MKFETYERAELPELWLVDTASNSILVYRRSSPSAKTFDVALEFSEGERLTSPMLPRLSVDITALFDR